MPESLYVSIPEGEDPSVTIRLLQESLSREKSKMKVAAKEMRRMQEKNVEQLLVVKKEMQVQQQVEKKKYKEEKNHWDSEIVIMKEKNIKDWKKKKEELEKVHMKKQEDVVSILKMELKREAINREERAITSAVNEAVTEAMEWRCISTSFARWRHHAHQRGVPYFVVSIVFLLFCCCFVFLLCFFFYQKADFFISNSCLCLFFFFTFFSEQIVDRTPRKINHLTAIKRKRKKNSVVLQCLEKVVVWTHDKDCFGKKSHQSLVKKYCAGCHASMVSVDKI